MDRQNPKGKELLEDIVTKRSFVSGIFAAKNLFRCYLCEQREKSMAISTGFLTFRFMIIQPSLA